MSVTINGTTGIDAVQSGTVDLTTDVTGVLPSANGGVGTGTITPSNLSTGAPSWTSDGVLSFNSGYGSVATAYACRAWVNFNGTGTVAIRASGNVTSITDNGTGDYTVNFTNAMPDVNYVGTFGPGMRPSLDSNSMVRFSNSMGQYPFTTTTYRFLTAEIGVSPVGRDADIVQAAFFR